jgi:drug/metabolite transporter (DMT)-like permease
MNPYILALCANLSFALGSQFFTHFTRIFSSTWMNTFKALFAAVAFGLTVLFTTGFHDISYGLFLLFLLSGAIGLGVGDIFLLKAFGEIGPGRTMVIFGFHPIIVGLFSFALLGQEIETQKFWGIIFFIICLFIFSLESFRTNRKWKVKGLIYAFLGMVLDASGVLLTRYSFDLNSNITSFEGNFHRCLGAIGVYLIISRFSPILFRSRLMSLDRKGSMLLIVGAFFGTYLSLAMYLRAIQFADNLALISSISITSVLFSSFFECLWDKKMPSRYLLLAFISFGFGMKFIFF